MSTTAQDYRDLALGQFGRELVDDAERAGVPVPFWEIGGDVVGSLGSVTICVQFASDPSPEQEAAIRAHANHIVGPVVSSRISRSLCWDPREWKGRAS